MRKVTVSYDASLGSLFHIYDILLSRTTNLTVPLLCTQVDPVKIITGRNSECVFLLMRFRTKWCPRLAPESHTTETIEVNNLAPFRGQDARPSLLCSGPSGTSFWPSRAIQGRRPSLLSSIDWQTKKSVHLSD
jgi:hypothetical protein